MNKKFNIKHILIKEMIGYDLTTTKEKFKIGRHIALKGMVYEYQEYNHIDCEVGIKDILKGYVGYVHSEYFFSHN